MKYNYGLHVLETELEKEKRDKEFNEKYFADLGGINTYRNFCKNVERVEQLEKAITILKNGLRGPEMSY